MIKYSKNLKKHRHTVFLSNKIFFVKLNYVQDKFYNNSYFYDVLKLKKKEYKIKKNFPFDNSSVGKVFSKNLFNSDKFFDFIKINNMVNKINYLSYLNFLLDFFRYSHILKFSFEFSILLFFLIYSFKMGTFY
jgi:hypothetical protein